MYSIDLTGKKALITGGTRGIGLSISKTLAQSGAQVGAIYHSNDVAAEDAITSLKSDGRGANHFALRADISIEQEARLAARNAIGRFEGNFDFLILDAAAGAGGPLTEMTTDSWLKPFDVNVHGAFYLISECANHIRPGGSIVFISSGAGHDPMEGLSAYGASKAAVNHLSTILAQELGPKGIRVNTVSPGRTYTGDEDINSEPEKLKYNDGQKETIAGTALRRLGTAQDVANVVLFFVSDLSGFVTGQWIRVNGGRV